MCDSRIKPECTGGRENKLGDGRVVCNACLSCVTGGQGPKLTDALPGTEKESKPDWGDNYCR